jgi:hypothetical protein
LVQDESLVRNFVPVGKEPFVLGRCQRLIEDLPPGIRRRLANLKTPDRDQPLMI